MNWQHLRMLAIYAQRWAAQLDRQEPFVEDSIKVIEAIVKDIEKMKPQNALTARDEIAMKIREETDKPKPIPSPYFFRKT